LTQPYDAVLVVSFGGPEGPDDVLPFLENVLRGKNVPRERMLAVAEHYQHFGGVSPINAQNRDLIAALQKELAAHGPNLPIYWGNRNWHPLLPDTFAQMARDGVKRALGFFTSAYSSYSGCRQYRENIAAAQQIAGPAAPVVEKLRMFYNHPGFIDPMIERVRDSLQQIPAERRAEAHVIYTAHSIPNSMADNCNYASQIAEAARLVSESLGIAHAQVAYQSRSGPPQQPWLEPDVCDVLRKLKDSGLASDVVVVPIGFLSDHVEVLYDLDTEAKDLAGELGLNLVRAATVGSHSGFVRMIRQLIAERVSGTPPLAIGNFGPSHDVCPADCCLYPVTRPPAKTT
jgi:ferrochelatase